MKAITWPKYGSVEVLKYEEVEKPVPKDDEVLIKVIASTVTAGDCELRRFEISPLFWLPVRLYVGIFNPKKSGLGQELSGEIEAVGKDVTRFKVGDQVFAATGPPTGSYAQYLCLKGKGPIALKPINMTFEEAATIPTGGLNALYFLKKGKIQPGEKVLINGAGGSIGTYSVQLAKSYGAEVTVVDSADKLDMLSSIGADHVIDYTKEDFTQNGEKYHVIFDVVGKSDYSDSIKSLKPNGRYLLAHPRVWSMLRSLWTSWTSSKIVMTGLASQREQDLQELKELVEAGKLKSVIDRRYPLAEMAAAHLYVETDAKAGNVVINL